MNAKQGFHWKTLESKPDNWETLHALIHSVNQTHQTEPVDDVYWKKAPKILSIFIKQFPETQLYFPPESLSPLVESTSEGKSKKKSSSLKHVIKNRVEEEFIMKDLSMIEINSLFEPLCLTFSMQITYVLMILYWNIKIHIKNKKNQISVAIIDAIISLTRIYKKEEKRILLYCPGLKVAFERVQEIMNSKVNDKMFHVLFKNPVLLVHSTVDVRKESIQLYKEQLQLIERVSEAIRTDRPLLIGNQMPTGTGKTFLAVPLAQRLSQLKKGKTVLFACSNELVTEDIARTALLGDDLHLWMAKLIREEKTGKAQVLLRPHKRCFPDKWKQVYRSDKEEKVGSVLDQWNFYCKKTARRPDIVVADLEACLLLLQHASDIKDPFVAYVDEFISNRTSNELMGKIAHYFPKQTIILSAILPTFSSLEPMLSSFQERHDPLHQWDRDTLFLRVNTLNVPITCVIIDSYGKLRFPHHQVRTVSDLQLLLTEIRVNPRLRRCYTAKHVYFWTQTIQSLLKEVQLDFRTIFPTIGLINNTDLIEYVIHILETWVDRFEEWKSSLQQYAPSLMDPPSSVAMLTTQSHFFEGKTLWVSSEMGSKLEKSSFELFQNEVHWSSLKKEMEIHQKHQLARLERLENMKSERKSGASNSFNKLERERQEFEINDSTVSVIRLPPSYVINSVEHYQRFHPEKTSPLSLTPRYSIPIPTSFYEAFPDQDKLNMMAGIGLYSKQYMTEYQRTLVMSIYSKLCFLCSGKEIVFGTNLPELVNVWISEDFAKTQSISTLYQLMGRVGRLGKSYHANIILEDEDTVNKILSLDCNVDLEEIDTILSAFQSA